MMQQEEMRKRANVNDLNHVQNEQGNFMLGLGLQRPLQKKEHEPEEV